MEKIFGISVLAMAVLLAASVGAQGSSAAAVAPTTAAPPACAVPLLLRVLPQLNDQVQSRAARPALCLSASGFEAGVMHAVTR